MPQYDWNEGFDMKELIGQINHENDSLFRNLKTAISVKLNMPFQQVGCKFFFDVGYLIQ